MWENNYSRRNSERTKDMFGKNPYSKELMNLMLTRVDMETTFIHHFLPGAVEFLYGLFGNIDLGSSYVSALEVLKNYYKDGENLYNEYMKYLGDLGAVNISDENKSDFLRDKVKEKKIYNIDYGKKLMEVYAIYQYSLFNIVRLDERIEEVKKLHDEHQNRPNSKSKSPKKMKIWGLFSNVSKREK